jgi:prepilin-type processing-associated H-X9-DG protein
VDTLDPRVTPARADLAAKHLEGKVRADRYVEGAWREVTAPQAPVRKVPSHDAPLETEALRGEYFVVYDSNAEGWSWGQLLTDGYVGWMPTAALGAQREELTHRVSALRTLVLSTPSIKVSPVETLPLGSLLAIKKIEGDFGLTAAGFYVPAKHLTPFSIAEKDFVAIAERFVGTPYVWGGKTNLGIDCSGLVQVALMAAGKVCPRDSDMQEQELGTAIEPTTGLANLHRGDLLFWDGHVAIACDANRIVHANAFHMAVAVEPAADAVQRIAATGAPLKSIKRLSGLDRRNS